jgi:hypothetical protein
MKIFNSIIRKIFDFGRDMLIEKREPKIESKCDLNGNYYWQVYDYTKRKFYEFASEQEVRIWIETRYRF